MFKNNSITTRKISLFVLLIIIMLTASCKLHRTQFPPETAPAAIPYDVTVSERIAAYDGKAYMTVNDNVPLFNETDLTTDAFEWYSELDALGRCGTAYANICKELMPTEPRGKIGNIQPSGWHTVRYDFIDGKYLYNRCHLIGYRLAGENANKRNLITGTRYLNIQGMLPFEDKVAGYVTETGHHVLYRVTPIYDGDNLLADGVQIEAQSVEDDTIKFNVFCFNVQPDVTIDYATGNSWSTEDAKRN